MIMVGPWVDPYGFPKVYNGRDKDIFFLFLRTIPANARIDLAKRVAHRCPEAGRFFQLNWARPLTIAPANPILNPCDNNNPILQGQIFDPSTTQTIGTVTCRKPFPGNQIPTISTVAQNILNLIPEPTNPGQPENFIFTSNNPILSTTMTFRIDQNLSRSTRSFFLQ